MTPEEITVVLLSLKVALVATLRGLPLAVQVRQELSVSGTTSFGIFRYN